jgi:RHS repeat-associated protein
VGYLYFAGQLLAQYSNSTTYFIHKDHLGSTRLLTAMDKSVNDSMDYLPFGEQIAGSTGTTHKFTSKERDPESGLDNFDARFDSSTLGRFMSPDPSNFGADPTIPQSWNAYAYVLNNPTNAIDPYGLDCVYANADGSASVKSGDCKSENDEGIFVDGKVKASSIEVTQDSDGTINGISFAYTPADGSSPILHSESNPDTSHARFLCKGGDMICNAQGALIRSNPHGNIESADGMNLLLAAPFAGAITGSMSAGETAIAETATSNAAVTTTRVVFGQGVGHGARHLAGSGLSQVAVENAIKAQVEELAASSSTTGSFWGKVVVNGQEVFYRAHTLPDGTINVGTYTVGAP